MSFFVFILVAIFCGTSFFIFQDIVWLAKHRDEFLVVSFISSAVLAIVAEANLRCGDFLSEKSCRQSTGSFSFFLVVTTRHSLSFHKFERQSYLFGLDNAIFLLVDVNWECSIFDFSFFSADSYLFVCLSVMRFFSLQLFRF